VLEAELVQFLPAPFSRVEQPPSRAIFEEHFAPGASGLKRSSASTSDRVNRHPVDGPSIHPFWA
jgi:hypothetical protein